jgi:hypothetical protein
VDIVESKLAVKDTQKVHVLHQPHSMKVEALLLKLNTETHCSVHLLSLGDAPKSSVSEHNYVLV